MNTTAVILLVLLAIYVPIWIWTYKSAKAKAMGFEIWGPAIKINTRFGIRLMDRLCVYHRFWRFFGVASQIISAVLMVFMIVIMALAVIRLPSTLNASGVGIEYAIAIPGLNPLMPLWYTLLAFIVALVCHELAHGLQARSNGMGVKHTGLLYGVVPLGAFVEPDEEDVKKASRRARLDLYAAGISTNFVIGAVSFLLFSTALLGGVSSPYGDNAGVYSNTDADGVPAGAIILEIDGKEFTVSDLTASHYSQDLWQLGTSVTVTYITSANGEHLTKNVIWGAGVATVSDNSPASTAGIHKGDTVFRIDDAQGVSHYFYSNAAFSNYMKTTKSGDSVTVYWYSKESSSVTSKTITLGSGSGCGFLGVSTTTAGMALVSPNQVLDYARNPFYGATDVSSALLGALSYISHPFNGYTPVPESLHWWYGESFPGFWAVTSIFYWMFWLNILLGVTNALPAVPFDGGYIFRGWLDKALEKLGKTDVAARESQCDEITHNVSVVMLFLLLIVVFAALT